LDRTLERSKDRIERRDKIYDRSLDRRIMRPDRMETGRSRERLNDTYDGQVSGQVAT